MRNGIHNTQIRSATADVAIDVSYGYINPPNVWKRGAVNAVIFCLVQRHYPAELDLPGVRAVVCLLNSLPKPPCDEMIACKTTGNYSPFKSLGMYYKMRSLGHVPPGDQVAFAIGACK